MKILSENVIPGNHGKTFETNAEDQRDLDNIKNAIMEIEGISSVLLDNSVFPKEITVHTTDFVKVADIQKAMIKYGFHAIPKTLFAL